MLLDTELPLAQHVDNDNGMVIGSLQIVMPLNGMRRVEVTAEDNHWMMEVSTNIFSTYSHSASSPEGPLEQDTGAMTWALSFRLINEFETDSTERKRRTSSGCWRKHRQTVAIWSTKYFHAVEWGFCNILLEVW